jgi:diaminopimelate decarboxylase
MGELVDGFDIASGGELGMALNAGLDPSRISFAGPGKRDMELQAAIMRGVTLNLESEGEAQRALNIAERIGKTPRLAIRVNPDFGLAGSGMKMGGGAKPFGIDAERACPCPIDSGCGGGVARFSHLCRIAIAQFRRCHRNTGANHRSGRKAGG